MSNWCDRILREFTPHAVPLTLVPTRTAFSWKKTFLWSYVSGALN